MLRKLGLLMVMFAVLSVPAFAVLTDAYQSLPFDTDYTDNSGYGNDATNSGASIDNVLYKVGTGSADINSGTDKITMGSPYSSGTDDFSISFWLYSDGWVNSEYIITSDKTLSGAQNKMQIYMSGTNQIRALFKDTSNTNLFTTATVHTGWQHVVYTRSGGDYKVYINGTLDNSLTGGRTGDVLGTAGLTTGSTGGSASQGNFDQVMFYRRELSPSEVSDLYNSGAGLDPYAATDTSFNITAADAETAAAINTFNVSLNGTVLTTTNGTINYNVTGEYTTIVQAKAYQPVTTTYTYAAGSTVQWNLTKIDRNVTFKAFNNFTAPLNNFNLSIDGTPYTTSNGTIIAELDRTVLHNLTFTAEDYYPNVLLDFNVTNDFNATLTTVFSNTTFTAVDEESSTLSNFNVTIDAVTTNIAGTSGVIELDTRNLYDITFSKEGYTDDAQTNVNVSSSVLGNLSSYFQITVTASTPAGGIPSLQDASQSLPYDSNYTDESGNGNNAVGNNTDIDGVEFLIGNASVLHNNNIDSVNLGSPYANGTADFTMSFWFNPDSWNTGDVVYSSDKVLLGQNAKTQIFYSGTAGRVGELRANFKDTSAMNLYTTGINLTPGSWFHIVYTRTGGDYAVYVNGSLVDSITGGSSGDVFGGVGLMQGHNDKASIPGIKGNIDQFLFYQRELNATAVTQLYNSGAGVNPYEGASSVSSTDEYKVLWNGTNYYPNAANITFLPTRNTIENFTVYPDVAQFKVSNWINYDTTNHLSFQFNNSHEVTAFNRYDSSSINNFTVVTPVQSYTANGTKAYLQNDTGVINYSVTHPSYFNVTALNVDVTNGSSSVEMHQAELRFNGTQRFTNNTVADGNVTIGLVTNAFGEPFYLDAGTYTAYYSSVNDEAVPQNFTVSALQNVTDTIVNITNANLTITGINAVDGTPISFFTTTVVNNTLFINLSETAPSPHLYNLLQNTSLNVTFDNSTYALNNTLITLNNRSTSYTFYVYTTNSFNISILDEQNATEITNTNFTVDFIGNYQSYNYTYTNGDLYADLIVPDLYQIRYEWINESGAKNYGLHRQYFHQLTNRTHNRLDMYALLESASTEITVNVQNSDTLQRQEGVYVLLQRFYLANNSYETVAMYKTDTQGNAYFDVELENELYRFSIQSPFGTTLRTTSPAYLQETSYIIYTGDEQTVFYNPISLGELNATFDWDNTTETLTVNYDDPEGVYGTYTLNLYEEGVYTNTLVNSSSASSSSGALVVSYAFKNDSEYLGTLTVSNSPAIVAASFRISDFTSTMPLANLSLFLVSILFVIMTFVSAFSLYSVVLGAIALVGASMMGLLTFSGPVVGMILFGAIMLAIILEWRRG